MSCWQDLAGGGRLTRLTLALAALVLAPVLASGDDWPQWLGPQRDGVWRETGILTKFPPGGPKVHWRTPIAGGYTGPAVSGGRVYVMDRLKAEQPKPAEDAKDQPVRKEGPGKERVLCLNEADGNVIWKHEYDCVYKKIGWPVGPRTTPIVHQGKVYTLGAMGDLYCLEATTGKPLWSKNFLQDYQAPLPVWGWSAAPLLDGDRLITLVGGPGCVVVAFHKDTGKELWRALTAEEIGYAPPMLYEAGGQRQLIVWHTEAVASLDPETGKTYWTQPYPVTGEPRRPAVSIGAPRLAGNLLFISSFYHGPLMLELAADRPAAKVRWKGKSEDPGKPDGLHAIMTTPVLKDGHIYGVCGFGELRCLKIDTGEQLWETYAAVAGKKTFYGTAFLVPQADRFFLFNEQGDLIIARLTPKGYQELDRAHVVDPSQDGKGREVVWSHPAFANRRMYVRNDKEIVCVDLAEARSG